TRSTRWSSSRALQVRELIRRVALADHELLHLVDLVLTVDADIHGDAGLLEIGIHGLDRHEHDRRLDLVADHRRDVGRTADQPDGLRFEALFLEVPTLD